MPFTVVAQPDPHPARGPSFSTPPAWSSPRLLGHAALSLAAVVLVGVLLGLPALAYLFASLFFVYTLHPLSGRFIQEHHLLPGMGEQETASYVGPLNLVSLNFGLHTEHHDFPAIPWSRLPAVRRLAPEGYDTRVAHRSWTKLWLQFLFDTRLSHHSRAVRKDSAPSEANAVSASR